MTPVQYIVADTVAEAIAQIGDGGVVLAGGTTLVPRPDKEVPARIVDISKISELRGIQDSGELIRIGAAVTLERAAEALSAHPSLRAVRDALLAIGNPHIRLVATVGGNVCADDQTRDLATALTALGARVTVAHRHGVEETAIDAFLPGTAPARLLTTITISIDRTRRSSFQKFAWRLTSAPAVFNVAAAARVLDRRLSEVRIVIGGAEKAPIRVTGAEAFLEGRVGNAATLAEAASLCARGTSVARPTFATTGYLESALPQIVHEVIAELSAEPQ